MGDKGNIPCIELRRHFSYLQTPKLLSFLYILDYRLVHFKRDFAVWMQKKICLSKLGDSLSMTTSHDPTTIIPGKNRFPGPEGVTGRHGSSKREGNCWQRLPERDRQVQTQHSRFCSDSFWQTVFNYDFAAGNAREDDRGEGGGEREEIHSK